jgi:spermidine synthase
VLLLEELDTEFGNIKIMRSKSDGTYTYYQDACFHSQINAEGVSTCGYVHVMYSIIKQSMGQRVLMIGGAGGTLATMLHRLGCKVTVVDINPHAFTLAKKYFQMPEAIECVVDDGCSYLLGANQRYDAIAIDAFDSNGTVPEQFTTEDFFRVAKEALKPFGVVVMNAMIAHDLDMLADRIALNMESAELPAVLFDRPGRHDRNIIIAGGVVDQVRITSYRKPVWVRHELHGIMRRNAKKQVGKLYHTSEKPE